MAADFDQSMRNVNSIMGVSEKQLAKFSEQVRNMSTRFPQSAETLANGLYDIASSGFAGADAMEILEASARAASAGMTEAEVSSKAIVSVLNAYGLEAKDAARVSDVLFRGVDKGVLTFEELASSLGDYVGAASQLKIPIEDVVAAQAAMTLTGISAAEAATSLNQVMRSLLKPSEDMTKTLKELGFESGQAALESIGLHGVIEALAGEVGNNVGAWLDLFPEIRAARGAMALAANDGENLNRIMADMEDVTGATGRAFGEQSKGAMFQFRIAMNRLNDVLIELGNEIIPILTKHVIPAIQGAVRWFSRLSDESKELAIKLAGLALLAGPLLGLVGSVVRIGAALRGMAGAGAAVGATKAAGAMAVLGRATGRVTPTMQFLGRTMARPTMWQPAIKGATTLTQKLGLLSVAAGRFLGAYSLGDIPSHPPRELDELITKYESMGDAARMAIFGVDTAQEGLLASIRHLNAEAEAQGSSFRVNAKAFALAADSGLNYSNALKLVAAGLDDVNPKITEQLIPAFNAAKRLTGEQAESLIGLTRRITNMRGPLTDLERGYVEWFLKSGDVAGAQEYLAETLEHARKTAEKQKKGTEDVTGALKDATGPAKRLANEFVGVGKEAQTADGKVERLNHGIRQLPKRTVVTVDADISPAMTAIRTLRGALSGVGATISGIGTDVLNVPGLHSGGHVERSGLAVVHRGEVFSGVNQDFGPFGEAGRVVNEIHDARHAFLRAGSQAIRRTMTPKEAQDWRQLMRAELRAPGVSALQRELLSSAVRAVRDETTREEARGFRRSIRDVDGRPRIDIHVDRRRFAGSLAYDHTYRGW